MPSRGSIERGLNVWFALTAGAFALFTTFSRIDTVVVGQRAWGVFLMALAVGHTAVMWKAHWPRGWWSWLLGHAGSAVVIGVISFWFATVNAVALLLWSIAVWTVLSGASYLLQGLRQSRDAPGRSDWLVLGGLNLLLGLATLIEPVDALWLMGSAGAWAAIVAVFTAISAAHQPTTGVPHESEERN